MSLVPNPRRALFVVVCRVVSPVRSPVVLTATEYIVDAIRLLLLFFLLLLLLLEEAEAVDLVQGRPHIIRGHLDNLVVDVAVLCVPVVTLAASARLLGLDDDELGALALALALAALVVVSALGASTIAVTLLTPLCGLDHLVRR
jgi:hypothetical protein